MITLEFDTKQQQYKKRRLKILNLLSNISKRELIEVTQQNERGALIISVTDKDTRIPKFRFKTINQSYLADYKETWVKQSPAKFYLKEINLSIYNIEDEYLRTHSKDEFVLLHTEPNYKPTETENISPSRVIYKKSPHIHIECATKPIPKAHIALNIDNYQTVTASLDALDEAIIRAVKLIKDEILDRT